MYLPIIYKNSIFSSLFEIAALNFTMYISTILTCSLKIMPLENRFFKTQSYLNSISVK